MLNISPNNRNGIDEQQFVSYQNVNKESSNPKLKRTLYIIGAIILIFILGTKVFWSILVLTISIYLLIFVSSYLK